MKKALFIVLTLTLALVSCSQGQTEIKPPDIRYGEDTCAQCDMIISDPRFAAAAVTASGAGSYESLAFDDIGDLLAYTEKHASLNYVALYVHDFESEEWIDAATATYVHSSDVRSPMASGLIASREAGQADTLARQYQGEVFDWATVQKQHASGAFAGAMHGGSMGGMNPTPSP